jgi:hypothetical protein
MFTIDDIRKLLDNAPKKVLSLILKVDPADQANQSDTPAWKIYAKNAFRDIELTVTEKQLPQWQEIRQRAEDFLETYSVKGKTLALFAAKDGFFETYDMPMALENDSAYSQPLLLPLLWAIDEHEPALVVLVDNEKADFLKVYLNSADTNTRMRIDFDQFEFGDDVYTFKSGGAAAGTGFIHSSQKDDYVAVVQSHLEQFHRDVVAEIEKRLDGVKVKRLILGGNEEAAKQVQNLLPEKQSAMCMGVLPIPFIKNEKQIVEAISELSLTDERSQELDLVNSVIDLAKSGGRGALGKKEVEQAITFQQIELLILPYPPKNPELAMRWIKDVFNMSGSVEFVDGSAAERLEEEGGVAARLYYRIAEQTTQ